MMNFGKDLVGSGAGILWLLGEAKWCFGASFGACFALFVNFQNAGLFFDITIFNKQFLSSYTNY